MDGTSSADINPMDVDACGCQDFYDLIEDPEAAREAFDIKNIFDVIGSKEPRLKEKRDKDVRNNETSKSFVNHHENEDDPTAKKTVRELQTGDDYFQDIGKVLYHSFFKNFEANEARSRDKKSSLTRGVEEQQTKLSSAKSKLFEEDTDLDELEPSISHKVVDVNKVIAAKAAGKDLSGIQMTEVQKSTTESFESLDPSISEKVMPLEDFIAEKKALARELDLDNELVPSIETRGKDLDNLGQINRDGEVQGPASRKGMDKYFGRGRSQKRLENLVCGDDEENNKSNVNTSIVSALNDHGTSGDCSWIPQAHTTTNVPHQKYLPHKKKILLETSDKIFLHETASLTSNKNCDLRVLDDPTGLCVNSSRAGRLDCELSLDLNGNKDISDSTTSLVSNCRTKNDEGQSVKNFESDQIFESGQTVSNEELNALILAQNRHEVTDRSLETGGNIFVPSINQNKLQRADVNSFLYCDDDTGTSLDDGCTENISDVTMNDDFSRKRKLFHDEIRMDRCSLGGIADLTRDGVWTNATKSSKLMKENLDCEYPVGVSQLDIYHRNTQELTDGRRTSEPQLPKVDESSSDSFGQTPVYFDNFRQVSNRNKGTLHFGEKASKLIHYPHEHVSEHSIPTSLSSDARKVNEIFVPTNSKTEQEIGALPITKSHYDINRASGTNLKQKTNYGDGENSAITLIDLTDASNSSTPPECSLNLESPISTQHPGRLGDEISHSTRQTPELQNKAINYTLACSLEVKNAIGRKLGVIVRGSETVSRSEMSQEDFDKTSSRGDKTSHSDITNKLTYYPNICPNVSPHVTSSFPLTTTEIFSSQAASETFHKLLPRQQQTISATYKVYPMFLLVKEPSHLSHGSDQSLKITSESNQPTSMNVIKSGKLPASGHLEQPVQLLTFPNTAPFRNTASVPPGVCSSDQFNPCESKNYQANDTHQHTGREELSTTNTAARQSQAQGFSATSLLMSLIPHISKDLNKNDPRVKSKVLSTAAQSQQISAPNMKSPQSETRPKSSASTSTVTTSSLAASMPQLSNPQGSFTSLVTNDQAHKLPPCRVCEEKASGLHFGVNSCEACNEFFRRTLKLNKTYSCLRGQSCDVSGPLRNDCCYCRFQKCLSAGMSRDRIKTGRYSHKKITLDTLELRQLEDVTCLDSTQQGKFEQTILELNNLFSASGDSFCIPTSDCLKDHKEPLSILSCVQHVETFIKSYLQLVRSLPRFGQLDFQDQMTLAKKSWMEFLFFTQFKGARNVIVRPDTDEDNSEVGSFDSISKLRMKLKDLNPPDTVLTLMKVITLTSPNCVRLVNRDAVEELNSGYVQCLHYELGKSAVNSRSLLTDIMALSVELRTVLRCLDTALCSDVVNELFKCPLT